MASPNSIIIGFNRWSNSKDANYIIYSYSGLDWKYLDKTNLNIRGNVHIAYDNNDTYYLTDQMEYYSKRDPDYVNIVETDSKSKEYINIYKSTDCLNWTKIESPLPDIDGLAGHPIRSLIYYNNSLLIYIEGIWLRSDDKGNSWEIFDYFNVLNVFCYFYEILKL